MHDAATSWFSKFRTRVKASTDTLAYLPVEVLDRESHVKSMKPRRRGKHGRSRTSRAMRPEQFEWGSGSLTVARMTLNEREIRPLEHDHRALFREASSMG